MTKTEFSPAELVSMSADYFASNPDVDYLVAVVGSGTFYRPEREGYAEHDAAVGQTTTRRVHRHELPAADGSPARLVEVEGAVLMPIFPAAVQELADALDARGEVTARKMAEGIYCALHLSHGPERAEALTRETVNYLESEVFAVLAAGSSQGLAPAAVPSLADVVRDAQLFVFPAPAAAGEAPADDAPAAAPVKAKAAPKKKASTAANAS